MRPRTFDIDGVSIPLSKNTLKFSAAEALQILNWNEHERKACLELSRSAKKEIKVNPPSMHKVINAVLDYTHGPLIPCSLSTM